MEMARSQTEAKSRARQGLRRYLLVPALLPALSIFCSAQTTGKTVRHHRIAEEQANPELAQAEAAIQEKDYAKAEPLLQKAAGEKSRPVTKFERRGIGLGHPVRDLLFLRREE